MSWDPADPANRAMDAQRDEIAGRLLEGRSVRWALDLGCGRGEALETLGLPGVGVDLSIVRLHLAPGPVVQADGARLPFPDDTFDLVVARNVLSSIPDDDQRRAVASEVVRVLEAGGEVLWYDQRWPNPGNGSTRPVTRRDLLQLFPGAELRLEPVTLVPALGRAFPRSYHRLHRLRALRSHLIGLIRPDQVAQRH